MELKDKSAFIIQFFKDNKELILLPDIQQKVENLISNLEKDLDHRLDDFSGKKPMLADAIKQGFNINDAEYEVQKKRDLGIDIPEPFKEKDNGRNSFMFAVLKDNPSLLENGVSPTDINKFYDKIKEDPTHVPELNGSKLKIANAIKEGFDISDSQYFKIKSREEDKPLFVAQTPVAVRQDGTEVPQPPILKEVKNEYNPPNDNRYEIFREALLKNNPGLEDKIKHESIAENIWKKLDKEGSIQYSSQSMNMGENRALRLVDALHAANPMDGDKYKYHKAEEEKIAGLIEGYKSDLAGTKTTTIDSQKEQQQQSQQGQQQGNNQNPAQQPKKKILPNLSNYNLSAGDQGAIISVNGPGMGSLLKESLAESVDFLKTKYNEKKADRGVATAANLAVFGLAGNSSFKKEDGTPFTKEDSSNLKNAIKEYVKTAIIRVKADQSIDMAGFQKAMKDRKFIVEPHENKQDLKFTYDPGKRTFKSNDGGEIKLMDHEKKRFVQNRIESIPVLEKGAMIGNGMKHALTEALKLQVPDPEKQKLLADKINSFVDNKMLESFKTNQPVGSKDLKDDLIRNGIKVNLDDVQFKFNQKTKSVSCVSDKKYDVRIPVKLFAQQFEKNSRDKENTKDRPAALRVESKFLAGVLNNEDIKSLSRQQPPPSRGDDMSINHKSL